MTKRNKNQVDATGAEKLHNEFHPMIDGVRWSERYARRIEQIWKLLPNWLTQVLVTVAVFLLASGIQGIK